MLRKAFIAALPMLLAVTMLGSNNAYGVGGSAAVVEGTGSIAPGLTTTPTTGEGGSFGGTIVGAGVLVETAPPSPNAAVIVGGSCSFTYSSNTAATLASDSGTAQGTCGGGTQLGGTASIDCSAAASLSYNRAGSVVVITGNCNATVNGHTVSGSLVGLFVFVPTSTSTTVTSFALAGASVGVTLG